jgi:hypothetical protein
MTFRRQTLSAVDGIFAVDTLDFLGLMPACATGDGTFLIARRFQILGQAAVGISPRTCTMWGQREVRIGLAWLGGRDRMRGGNGDGPWPVGQRGREG